ncbi:phosphoglycerate kinase [Patescibacteria group bacterium]|nr:phosphoglycerate kinase [Patescibacteria group bacterium]
MQIRSVNDADVENKVVMVRVDYNVPVEDMVITDNTRIIESLANLRFLLTKGVKKIVIVSHFGRPLGSVVDDLRLKLVVAELESCLGEEVEYIQDDISGVTKKMIETSKDRVICLENIRFDQREEDGDMELAKVLANLADVFVLDAFSVAHRDHASVTKIAELLPAYAGLNMMKEYEGINKFIQNVKKPFWGFFGGIKLEDKIPVIQALSDKLDGVVFGSSIAVAFLKRFGYGVGDSVVSGGSVAAVDSFLEFKSQNNFRVVFPQDLVIGDVLNNRKLKVFDVDFEKIIKKEISIFNVCDDGEGIFDVGEKSVDKYQEVINKSGSIFWNGPFGYVEKSEFSNGTNEMANTIAEADVFSMAGGGDTVAVIRKLEISEKFDFVSTSGGALMSYIANKTLPGLEVLEKK